MEKLTISFEVNTPEDYRRSILNTIILSLRDLYTIETDNGCWDMQIKQESTNEIIESTIKELQQLKYKII